MMRNEGGSERSWEEMRGAQSEIHTRLGRGRLGRELKVAGEGVDSKGPRREDRQA